MALDWHSLYFGHVSPQEVRRAVADPNWQDLRISLKGLPLHFKHKYLSDYRDRMHNAYVYGNLTKAQWRDVEVRLTNYVTALSRGGLIKPEDYR